jgi:hypothetical protein
MAVIVRQPVVTAGREITIKSHLPARGLSPDERKQADRLDAHLAQEVPLLEQRVNAELGGGQSLVHKWYLLGQGLRLIITSSDLVMSADVDSGDLWKAVWWYLPRALKPSGPGGELPTYDVGHKRKDHLSLCYEISANPWEAVGWLQRWDDWHQISFRPTISRDPRVLAQLGASIRSAEHYPTRSEFRAIVKTLGDRFPSRRLVNTEVLSDDDVADATRDAVWRAIASDGGTSTPRGGVV